jgi:hypothetical protein
MYCPLILHHIHAVLKDETIIANNILYYLIRYYFFQLQTYSMLSEIYGLGLWCLTPLSTIFQYYIVAVSFIEVSDKHYHIMLHRVHLAWAVFEFTTLVVMGTDCICSHKSNCHTITATTAPQQLMKERSISF